jgi:hypothetical protein
MDETSLSHLGGKRTTVFSYRSMPIRWSPDLLARAMLKWWLWVPILVGLGFAVSQAHQLVFSLLGLLVFAVSVPAWVFVTFYDGYHKTIRRLLGRHRLGVSDPATWTEDLLQLVAPPTEWFGTRTFAAAVDRLLDEERYGEAMWAARLCRALEDESEGRFLTRQVLSHRGVRATLAADSGRSRDLIRPRHPRPFPLLKPSAGRAAAYWHFMTEDPTKEIFTVRIYSQSITGIWAYSDDTSLPLIERNRIGPQPPKDQLGPQSRTYRLGGSVIAPVFLLWALSCCSISSLFPMPTLADRAIAEAKAKQLQQQQAAPAPAPPANPGHPQPPPARPPAWAQAGPGNWRYLADLPEFDAAVGRPWTFAKDGTTGDPEKHSPIRVGGHPSPRGLGMHPPEAAHAVVKYRLDRTARRFQAAVAVSDSSTLLFSPLYFEVWGDGRRLWQSERITAGKQVRECAIDVGDVAVLELRAVAVGHHTGLHAVWLEPRVLMK